MSASSARDAASSMRGIGCNGNTIVEGRYPCTSGCRGGGCRARAGTHTRAAGRAWFEWASHGVHEDGRRRGLFAAAIGTRCILASSRWTRTLTSWSQSKGGLSIPWRMAALSVECGASWGQGRGWRGPRPPGGGRQVPVLRGPRPPPRPAALGRRTVDGRTAELVLHLGRVLTGERRRVELQYGLGGMLMQSVFGKDPSPDRGSSLRPLLITAGAVSQSGR